MLTSAYGATDYTGFWKGNCSDGFGVQIQHVNDEQYSISFCGPGGCFEPGEWTPNTKIDGDRNYAVISSEKIQIKNHVYIKCTVDPTWHAAVSHPPVASDFEIDLNGFRLQQYLSVVDKTLGNPFKTMEMGDMVANLYHLDNDAYIVVGHYKKYKYNIALLQITGKSRTALPFKNLVLGDSKEKVIQMLGKPDKVEVEGDSNPKLTMYSYNARNYSVELDENDRLYSIQIDTTSDLMTKTDSAESEWNDFKAAVLSKKFAAVSEYLKPDVEIYKSGKTLSIDTKFSDFQKAPNKEFASALIGDKNSVLQEISQSEPVQEFRLTEKIGMGIVYKFPNGKILNEIVFFPFGGKYRVYEIDFKESGK